jgi:hypothetical protein
LDDDDLFLPHHLELACRTLATTGLDFVYLGTGVSDRRVRSLPPDWQRMHRRMYEFERRFLQVANYVHTGSIVVRNFRDTAVRFDESLSHCEDWDMWIALTSTLGYGATCVGEVTTIYLQIAGVDGLVAAAQQVTPSPFSVVRERMYAKWPVDDPLVGPPQRAHRRRPADPHAIIRPDAAARPRVVRAGVAARSGRHPRPLRGAVTSPEVVLARHAEANSNVAGVIAGPSCTGLTAAGRDGAVRLGWRLRWLGGVGRIDASPTRRALETAEIAGTVLGLSVRENVELRVPDPGAAEGLTWAAVRGAGRGRRRCRALGRLPGPCRRLPAAHR